MTALSNANHALAARQRRSPAVYGLRLAGSAAELRAAQALRFEVFNLELGEGLVHSADSGLDADAHDAVCDHLIVSDVRSGQVVGTYRMQTGTRAAQGLGYYSEREFDFGPFEPQRGEILELGRACIHRKHRNFAVLNLLWTGIARYAKAHHTRYLLGCSSITSQQPAAGAAAYRHLQQRHLAPPPWQTVPHPAFVCAAEESALPTPAIPHLLSAYLKLGARICAAPAIDRAFRTIDFLTWLDTEAPSVQALRARGRFVA